MTHHPSTNPVSPVSNKLLGPSSTTPDVSISPSS
eukprot:CCRYP_011053-RG/>CCRYP_011053-RG protein AED:0.49 eAED:0.49 QI:0/-1/0/1/-1/0/1/0/33